jgi:hypothetical protein
MQFNPLTAQLESLKNLTKLATQLAEAKAAHRVSGKAVYEGEEGAEAQLLAALKAAGGKASTFLYAKVLDLGSNEELCFYMKGNTKPSKGTVAGVWGYWETPAVVSLEQITGLLSETEYNAMYKAEDDAYNLSVEEEAKRVEAEKAQKLADKEKAKAERKGQKGQAGGEPAGDGAGTTPPVGDAPEAPIGGAAEGGETGGESLAPAAGAESGAAPAAAPVAETAPAAPAAQAPGKPRGPKPAGTPPVAK